jgi:ABC-2 type transport system permease protein
MTKLLLVAHQEIGYHLRQWTFYLTIIMMPLIFAAIGAIPRLREAAEATPLPSVETILNTSSAELTAPIGYVDHADLINRIPQAQKNYLYPFPDEAAAGKALAQGQIESYYVIAADYYRSGQVTQYTLSPQLLAETDAAVRDLLRLNLLERLNDPRLAARLEDPVDLVRQGPAPPVARFIPATMDWQKLVSAILVVGFFAYVINIGGNLLLRALQREVHAHVLEVMIMSTTPFQLIGGKLLGLTALTLVQAGLTLLAGVLVYGQNPDGSGPAALPWPILILSTPYLLLGFLAYCGGIMGFASLWPNFRESGVLLGGLRLLALTPLIGALFILADVDGPLSVSLSLLPFTAHLLMPFRLLLADVPEWQWGLGLLILMLWTIFWIWLSARLFRIHGLLTGRSLTPRIIWRALSEK